MVLLKVQPRRFGGAACSEKLGAVERRAKIDQHRTKVEQCKPGEADKREPGEADKREQGEAFVRTSRQNTGDEQWWQDQKCSPIRRSKIKLLVAEVTSIRGIPQIDDSKIGILEVDIVSAAGTFARLRTSKSVRHWTLHDAVFLLNGWQCAADTSGQRSTAAG